MAIVNFIMQKKGGVGKSVTATLLYQALLDAGKTVLGVDTDPSNKSLAGYTELKVTKLHILNEEEDVDKTLFDALINAICELPEDAHVVIDNGSSNFVALRSYLKINNVMPLLTEMGHKIRIHAVIAGGPDIGHTCIGLIVWEKAHGLLPENHTIDFIDGNRQNVQVENLRLRPIQSQIGDERLGSKGFIEVKVSAKRWRPKHIVVWEEAHGPLPKTHVLYFADGDKSNFDLVNLMAFPKKDALPSWPGFTLCVEQGL